MPWNYQHGYQPSSRPYSNNPNFTPRPSYSTPSAHYATHPTPSTFEWLLDSGASHHVTADLNNPSLYSPYDGINEIMIDNDLGLSINHTSNTILPSSPKP